jgi:site-specific DNA recombinase
VVRELDQRGWRTKAWLTRKGQTRGGRVFTKTRLHKLLTNVVYTGQIRYRGELFAGEQPALVDSDTWQRVQDLLAKNGSASRQGRRFRSDALLAGLLHCRPCGCAMTPAHVGKRSGRRYAYYVCTGAQKRGWHTCPSKSVPAATLDRFVLRELVGLGDTTGPSPADAERTANEPSNPEGARPDPDRLSAAERVHLVQSRVERVDYDGGAGKVAITVRSGNERGMGQPSSTPDDGGPRP